MYETSWIDKEEYPFQSRHLELEMGRLHYVDEGEGNPIVMVHGTPTWSFEYRHLIKGLSNRYRCVAMDHVGFGLSDKPSDWSYRPEAHARNLEALIESLGLEDITLVVHDFGGPIGLSYAIRHPEKVKQLVIMNSWMWSLKDQAKFKWSSRFLGGPIGRLLYRQINFSPKVLMKMLVGDKSKLPKHIHDHYLKALPTPRERKGTWVFAKELVASSDWYSSLWSERGSIDDVPTLVIWGMKDSTFTQRELERWESFLTNAQTIQLDDIGHFVAEEMGNRLTSLVADFLEVQIAADQDA